MPIRFGPLGLSPTLAITNFGIDDNILNDASDPRRDFTMTVTPRLQARLRAAKVLMSGTVATGLVYYQKYSDQRSVDYTSDGRVDVDLGRFQPYAIASLLDTRERLNVELDVRAPRTQVTLAAGARTVLSPKTAMVVDFRQAGLEFAEGTEFEGVPLSRTLNSTTNKIAGGLEVSVTPLTTVSVTASQQTDRFTQSPERDSDSFQILPSIRMESPALVQGSLAVGYRRFRALDPRTPDYSGVVVQGALSHTFADRTKVDLMLSRDVHYSFETDEPYFLTTGMRAVATHLLRESLDVRALVGRDRLAYRDQGTEGVPGAPRTDRVAVAGVGVGYRFQPHVRTGLDVEFARRTSDRADREYDRTRVFASLTYGY